ncbi:hypothetical protein N658DRAFT_558251 [Parathielavia hyrcaniae]|uniref:Ubiquitin-like domain-containing protein n=1 Tax=Parathielavia hyrcaniae TaxID=113614 RepID=A0AAN6Q5J9_9PEZI|nr:hypothetical protein N658DRAFT_558251 [Parathielavia hyrcaniae]
MDADLSLISSPLPKICGAQIPLFNLALKQIQIIQTNAERNIGDFFAVAGLIERIAGEVKSYKEAPQHFQRLAIELDFLSKVCLQTFDLRPTNAEDLARLERIRAIALQCLGPLREFEEKMRRYESSLDPAANVGVAEEASARRRLSLAKKRSHWSAIAKHEVDKLRAILTSEILAINTLLAMQQWHVVFTTPLHWTEWKGLEDANAANRGFADQLTCLMNTTNTVAQGVHEYLASSKAAMERLEVAVVTARQAESEATVNQLQTIQITASESSGLIKNLVQGVSHMSGQLTKLFSLTEHLKKWIKAVLQACKDIIDRTQRTTGLLLSLHGLITSLEQALRRPDISLPILELENPFGVRMALPYQLCDTWEQGLKGKPKLRLVESRRFVLLQAQTHRAISPDAWSTSVAPGDKLAMSMVIERPTPATSAKDAAKVSEDATCLLYSSAVLGRPGEPNIWEISEEGRRWGI